MRMDMDTEQELRRRVAVEAIERRDKDAAIKAVDAYLRVTFRLLDLESLAEMEEDDHIYD